MAYRKAVDRQARNPQLEPWNPCHTGLRALNPPVPRSPFMFIQTEATPNPATLKFLPGRTVLPEGTLDMRDKAQAEQSPLAAKLFEIDGVSGVFFGTDFIAVTKTDGEWH